jgi:hypothetical protein
MTAAPFTGSALVSRAAAPTRITQTKQVEKATTAIVRIIGYARLIGFGLKCLIGFLRQAPIHSTDLGSRRI